MTKNKNCQLSGREAANLRVRPFPFCISGGFRAGVICVTLLREPSSYNENKQTRREGRWKQVPAAG